jgi:hypothetical protein
MSKIPKGLTCFGVFRSCRFGDDLYSVGNIDYDSLGDLQKDLLQLVRMSAWITLYWTKEVSVIRMNRIRFFQGWG